MKRSSPPDDPDSVKAAYLRALKWLSSRELSEAQVRARLAEKGFSGAAITPAVARLIEDRTIDDRRTAVAVARTEAHVRRHGPRRVMARLLTLGIDRELARDVVRELFGEEDEALLLEKALDRRLRGGTGRLADPRERQKVVAHLVRQGFSASAADAAIRNRLKR